MNITTLPPSGNGPTMTSREIAELCDKRHPDVKRDIENMFQAINLDARNFAHIYLDAMNRKQIEYRLPKRETLILVSGYDVALRSGVIDKLEKLEREKANSPVDLNNPALLRHLLLENVEKVMALEAEVKELEPVAAAYEHLTRSNGTLCITDAAKALEVGPKALFSWLKDKRWIYRRAGNAHWVGYQDKLQSGLLDHRVEEVTTSDGQSKITEQVRVTAKGLAKLAEVFAKVGAQ